MYMSVYKYLNLFKYPFFFGLLIKFEIAVHSISIAICAN